MDNLMDLIFGIIYNDHDSDLIGRDQVDDYTIDTCLTADVIPVTHSKWDIEVGMNYHTERICPMCKKVIKSNFWEYCPHCGAKMDGGEKNDD